MVHLYVVPVWTKLRDDKIIYLFYKKRIIHLDDKFYNIDNT